MVIDSPGLREIQLWDAGEGVGAAFHDIEALAGECRFRDCTHRDEPGCAVRDAVPAERLASWHKLRREAAAQSDDALERLRRKGEARSGAKLLRKRVREKR
jgi:ribosome biogenesis GTPase